MVPRARLWRGPGAEPWSGSRGETPALPQFRRWPIARLVTWTPAAESASVRRCQSPEQRPRMSRPPPGRRADYRWFHAITTRWMDHDVFQHVNNVNYFSYFDTAVTYYEIAERLVGLLDDPTHCVVAEVACRYYSSLAFPDHV